MMDLGDDGLPELFGRAVAELRPMPDVVGAAVRLGRRRRRRHRLALSGGLLGVTALAPAVGLPPDVQTEGSRAVGSWVDEGSPIQSQTRFKDLAAITLEALLPQGLGDVESEDWSMNAYRVTGPAGTFALTFRVDPYPADVAEFLPPTCAPPSITGALSCVQGRLPDGTPVTAMHARDGEGWLHEKIGHPISYFRYRNTVVMLALFADDARQAPVPLTDADLLRAVTDPRFVALVDRWAGDPRLSGPPTQWSEPQPLLTVGDITPLLRRTAAP